ncbi:class I SAM-dependent methyltransferase [Candidatus Woesearchaeota archaeon]|nr:class I SAM-dependent methyltransferase [Candidatus Woesearchaeota archaeon]
MNKAIDKILREQESLNKDGLYSTIDRETGFIISTLIKKRNPKNVLEVGTSIGYSGIWIASALKKGAKLTTIDGWKERAAIAKKNFKKSKLPIELIEGRALEIIPKLKTKFDAVFLDATKAEYLKYLRAAKLNKNALVIADNTISHAHKMKDFLDYAEKQCAFTIKTKSGLTFFVL